MSFTLRYQGRKRVHHADDAMAQILTDMPNAVEMAWSESVNQVPRTLALRLCLGCQCRGRLRVQSSKIDRFAGLLAITIGPVVEPDQGLFDLVQQSLGEPGCVRG